MSSKEPAWANAIERFQRQAPSGAWRSVEDCRARLERVSVMVRGYAAGVNLTGQAGGIDGQLEEGLATCAAASRGLVWVFGESLELRCAEAGDLARVRSEGASILDVGSGGGFPGLVLVACLRIGVDLVEPRAKRAAFLRLAVGSLDRVGSASGDSGLERGARVWSARVGEEGYQRTGSSECGEAGEPSRGRHAVLSARAVWAPPEWARIGAAWAGERCALLVHVRGGGRLEGSQQDGAAGEAIEAHGWKLDSEWGLGAQRVQTWLRG